MSSNIVDIQPPESQPKCTRGEKCIIIHIAVTLILILILMIVYSAHLYMVTHERNDMFRITRRAFQSVNTSLYQDTPRYESIGIVFINANPRRSMCNAVLMKPRWSLVPAHCVSIRSSPYLAEYLPQWKIRYKVIGEYKETDIKRGIAHFYYNKDDFSNNIGLFEHLDHILLPEFLFSINVNELFISASPEKIVLVGWNNVDDIFLNRVHLLESGRCIKFISSIVNALRDTESCVAHINRNESRLIDHGAGLFLNAQIVGFSSWGDRAGLGDPLVILAVAPFRDWLEQTMA